MNKFPNGTRVKIKTEPNSDWPEEEGVVIEGDCYIWGYSYVVKVDNKYRDYSGYDYGFREVTEDELEAI